jgi:gp25
MEHIRTQYGSIQTTDIGDFLCDVDEYDEDEAQKIEEFVNQQDNLLLNHIDIK